MAHTQAEIRECFAKLRATLTKADLEGRRSDTNLPGSIKSEMDFQFHIVMTALFLVENLCMDIKRIADAMDRERSDDNGWINK